MGVSIDSPSDPNKDILDLVAKGGQPFLDRLSQLANQTAAHDQALSALKLGKNAQDAYNQATSLKNDAEKARQAAADALTAARVQASKIVSDAQAEMDKSKAELKTKHDRLDTALAALRA